MLTDQLPELDRLVKACYRTLVKEFAGYRRELLRDFRDYEGVRLQDLGVVLGPEEIGEFGAPTGNLDLRAEEIVNTLITSMRALVVGASGSGSGTPTLCFLEGREVPALHWKVPPDQQHLAEPNERGVVKVRHVFAVRRPA